MGEITRLIEAIEAGDPNAANRLFTLLYSELRSLAVSIRAGERPDFSLEATEMVHIAYQRLANAKVPIHWKSREHVCNLFVTTMRRIVVDTARRRRALKHGGGRYKGEFSESMTPAQTSDDDTLAIDGLIEELKTLAPVAAKVVEYRYFCGLTMEETARVMELSQRTAFRKWEFARAWLYGRLKA